MKEKLIIHLPHAGLEMPKQFYNKIIISKNKLDEENLFISDYLVDKFLPDNFDNVIRFKYSRLFCDVERFRDDNKEEMSKLGMGAIYEKDSNQEKFININKEYKDDVLSNYYDKYHKLLDVKAKSIVDKYGVCYIIDLHSFSDEFVKKVLNLDNCPDICIGVCDNFLDEKLVSYTIDYFKNIGLDVEINYPYTGTIIPNIFYNKSDRRIKGMMIEINKRLYLDNNKTLNRKKYIKLKKYMDDYYEEVFNKIIKEEEKC